jgi:hypothetical protein
MANYLDHDEEAVAAERLVGPEGTRRLRETVCGSAALAGIPWWSKEQ